MCLCADASRWRPSAQLARTLLDEAPGPLAEKLCAVMLNVKPTSIDADQALLTIDSNNGLIEPTLWMGFMCMQRKALDPEDFESFVASVLDEAMEIAKTDL